MNKLNEEMKQKFKGMGTRRLPSWWVLREIYWWMRTDSQQKDEIDAHNEKINQQSLAITSHQESIAAAAVVAPATAAKKKNIKQVAFSTLFFPDDDWALLTDKGRSLSMSFLVADWYPHIIKLSTVT